RACSTDLTPNGFAPRLVDVRSYLSGRTGKKERADHRMKPKEILAAIIDNLTMPQAVKRNRLVFDTPEQEERFKHLLSKVPKKAEIVRAGKVCMLLVRPENVGKFGELIKENG